MHAIPLLLPLPHTHSLAYSLGPDGRKCACVGGGVVCCFGDLRFHAVFRSIPSGDPNLDQSHVRTCRPFGGGVRIGPVTTEIIVGNAIVQ